MRAIFLRELFWFVLSFVLSLVLAFFFLELLNLTASGRSLKRVEQVFSVQLYLIGCVVSFIAIYIVRIIVIALKRLVEI